MSESTSLALRPPKGRWPSDPWLRFVAKVRPDGDCAIWTGAISKNGYGQFWYRGRQESAHRYAYERTNGPIPAGLQIDHLCRRTTCVNVDHLEAVKPLENLLRADTLASRNLAKTHCKHGHAFTPENIYPYGGHRSCLICRRSQGRRPPR